MEKKEIKDVVATKQPLYLLFCKEVALLTNTSNTQDLLVFTNDKNCIRI